MSEENKFPKKWEKHLPDDFKQKANSASTEELEKAILTAETSIVETEKIMSEDEKILTLKEDLKTYTKGYKDTLNCETAKIRYSIHVLRERGAR